MGNHKPSNVTEPDFQKKNFWGKFGVKWAQNGPKIRFFRIFLRFYHQFFLIFCTGFPSTFSFIIYGLLSLRSNSRQVHQSFTCSFFTRIQPHVLFDIINTTIGAQVAFHQHLKVYQNSSAKFKNYNRKLKTTVLSSFMEGM